MTLRPEEFGYYIVTASIPGNISQNYTVTYHVISERKPDAPSNISLDCSISNGRAFIKWIPGFNGGVDQTFVVSYRTNTGLQKNTAQINLQSYATVTGLRDQTLYLFKVVASNRNGETSSEEVHCTTKESTVPNISGTIGGIVGSIFLLIVIALFIFIIRKYQIKCLERVPNLGYAHNKLFNYLTKYMLH
ncbi:uncharacterized protein LOC134238449 [Saccostrea cucullata]|uniref:uncharacterized protein LOC134238449 n=1 Tax=Saccostrea cuccullata TaxID=36930 RepID=UPI002ED2C2CC